MNHFNYVKKITYLYYFLELFCNNGIITNLFLASGILHHLPDLCSCPTPTIKFFPSGVNAIALINPTILTSNNKVSDLNDSPHCHNLTTPSREPANTNDASVI